MRACPCGCGRNYRIGLSRAARLYDELGQAIAALRPLVAAARRDPRVHGDRRTILCTRVHRAEATRERLLDLLHRWRPGVECPEAAEVTRRASCLLSALVGLVEPSACTTCETGRDGADDARCRLCELTAAAPAHVSRTAAGG